MKIKFSLNMEVSHVTVILAVFILPTSTKYQKQEHICGRPIGNELVSENDRIVAGYDVGYYRYSWYASIIRYGQVVCGAALVGPSTLVTAAHCYKEFLDLANKGYLRLETIYTVKLGVYNVCQSEPSQREYKIEKVYIHELYYTKKPYYDICLITLAGDTREYQPICLPHEEVTKKPSEGTVPGLGTLKYQGSMPCTVHEARLLVYNDTDCYNMINNTGNDPKAIKKAFCAGYMQGGIDTCQGDSGGPLQSINVNGDYVLLGIVSFGFHCAVPGLLGIYTDVSQYLDWIQEKSGLDAGIVNLIYNKTSPAPEAGIPRSTTPGSHRGKWHHEKPARKPFRKRTRRPIRIIVYKHKKTASYQ